VRIPSKALRANDFSGSRLWRRYAFVILHKRCWRWISISLRKFDNGVLRKPRTQGVGGVPKVPSPTLEIFYYSPGILWQQRRSTAAAQTDRTVVGLDERAAQTGCATFRSGGFSAAAISVDIHLS